MSRPVYEDPPSYPHAEAEEIFTSDNASAICRALVGVALKDDDAAWIEGWCVTLVGSSSPEVRGVAATCLGHVVRRFGAIGAESVTILEHLRDHDPEVAGQAADALEDVAMFSGRAS